MKIKYTLVAILCASLHHLYAQDIIKTEKGDLEIFPIQHATMVMKWDGKTIFVDPTGGAASFEKFGAPDIILITDIHGDHLNLQTINGLETNKAKFLGPQSVVDKLPAALNSKTTILNNGESANELGIVFEAIPMYNMSADRSQFHPKGRGNGYVLTMGKKRIYIAGDTEDIPEMRNLKKIDAAFICMNLPYTMTVEQAADAVLDFKPRLVYPYHFRGQGGLSDIQKFKQMVTQENQQIEVRLLDWY